MRKLLITSLFSFLIAMLALLLTAPLALANADDLIIQEDGSITLVMTYPVLGTSSADNVLAERTDGTVQIAQAPTQNTVVVSPVQTSDKKIDVTVKVQENSNKPASEQKRKVDQIVAKGANNRTIFTITPNNNTKQVTITQGTTQASTPLPITIDTKSKGVSTTINGNDTRIQILPGDAVKKIEGSGQITPSTLQTSAQNLSQTLPLGGVENTNVTPSATPQISLQAQNGQPVYQIAAFRQEKLLNLIGIASHVTVNVSAETGKTIKINQPLLFSILDFFFGSGI